MLNKDLFSNINIIFRTRVFITSMIYTKNVSFNITLCVGSADPLFALTCTGLHRIFVFVSSLVHI